VSVRFRSRRIGPHRGVALLLVALSACRGRGCAPKPSPPPGESAPPVALPEAAAPTPAASASAEARPDAEVPPDVAKRVEAERAPESDESLPARRCPKEMVDVANRVCIDRYEDSLVDDATGAPLSPHYPPEPGLALRMFDKWQEERLTLGPPAARAMALPIFPEIERTRDFEPRAVSVRHVLPQGYISGRVAAEACARAKKRLCTYEEWKFACRGERQSKFPYGNEYQQGTCNVFRSSHPSQKLHDNASIGHSDPRLGLAADGDGPLLRPTGSTKACASRWGKDAIYDMVGNQDEWIDDPDGTFVGGFYSRSTKEGCDSIITVHPLAHWDYSIGLRCCR